MGLRLQDDLSGIDECEMTNIPERCLAGALRVFLKFLSSLLHTFPAEVILQGCSCRSFILQGYSSHIVAFLREVVTIMRRGGKKSSKKASADLSAPDGVPSHACEVPAGTRSVCVLRMKIAQFCGITGGAFTQVLILASTCNT